MSLLISLISHQFLPVSTLPVSSPPLPTDVLCAVTSHDVSDLAFQLSCIKRDIFFLLLNCEKTYLYGHIDEYMYDFMYSATIIATYLYILLRKKKQGLEDDDSERVRGANGGLIYCTLRRTLPSFSREKKNTQI